MLVSNLFLTMALGTVVSARAVEKSDREYFSFHFIPVQ